jgi:thiaminase/transcriptional activator TenA
VTASATLERRSDRLRAGAQAIWSAALAHPFLQELRAGRLPLERFRFFLVQDYLYLGAFARAVAVALAKAPDDETVQRLARRVLTPVERPLHARLFAAAGVDLDDVAAAESAPTNLAYQNHLLATALTGGTAEVAAALLPCPWIYHEMGAALGPIDHPVYGPWARFYAEGGLADSVAAWRELVDELPGSEPAMLRAFRTSCRYELA